MGFTRLNNTMIGKFAIFFFNCIIVIAIIAISAGSRASAQQNEYADEAASKFLYNTTTIEDGIANDGKGGPADFWNRTINITGLQSDKEAKSVMKINRSRSSSSSFKSAQSGDRVNKSATKSSADEESTAADLNWIAYPFREALANFVVHSENNEACNRQLRIYQSHLRNQTLWAVRLYESTQNELIGLLGGTAYQMGSYEECVKTRYYDIKGKYCLANFQYGLKEPYASKFKNAISDDDNSDVNYAGSVWQALEKLEKDPVRVSRTKLHWGFCMPDACNHEDLRISLNSTMVPIFDKHNIDINITVDDILCSTNDKLPFDRGFYIMTSFMLVLLSLNVFSSLYDIYEFTKGTYAQNPSGFREVLAAFSIIRNSYNLGIYNKDSQVKIASAMKVLMMMLIIYGHSLLYLLGYPHFYPQHLEEVYRRGADIALVNTNIVDVFFTISGFITFYYGFHPMKIGGVVYLILSIVFRYIRLMPVFAIVIGYMTFILPHTSDGPIWKARVMPEVENCRENWWSDLLLINNFQNVNKSCVLISWYITDDMLLCMLASVLIYIIVKRPKFGLFATLAVFATSIVITYSVTYINKYGGLLKLYMNFLEEPRRSKEFEQVYVALYSRAGPYLVGFLSAYVTIKLQERKFQFSLKWLIIGSILAIAIGEGSQYYGVVFYQFGRPYNPIENALYSSLHRIFFAVLFSWFLMVYLTTGFGVLDPIINNRMWTVLGRLTYSVFLMNTLSLITLTASTRTPWFASYKFILFMVLGDLVTTYVLGFLFYLYAEAPICCISKLIQKSLAKLFEKEIDKAKAKADQTKVENHRV